MKRMYFILTAFFLFTRCSEEETKQQNEMYTENATLYYYFDAGFGTSQCSYVIETESNKIFAPNAMFDLSEFTSNNGSNTENKLKITYRLTENKIERCFHKDGFLQNMITIIEVTMAEKI